MKWFPLLFLFQDCLIVCTKDQFKDVLIKACVIGYYSLNVVHNEAFKYCEKEMA